MEGSRQYRLHAENDDFELSADVEIVIFGSRHSNVTDETIVSAVDHEPDQLRASGLQLDLDPSSFGAVKIDLCVTIDVLADPCSTRHASERARSCCGHHFAAEPVGRRRRKTERIFMMDLPRA